MPKKRTKTGHDSTRKRLGRAKESAIIPVPPSRNELPATYGRLLDDLKQRIASERFRVVLAANSAMVLLYWDIGRVILDRQEREGWGAKVIDRLSSGLSSRNLKYMRAFADAWPERAIVQQVAAQIP